MGVYIKGMEMPKSCDECRFAVDGWCYACIPESDAERQRITTNYCPLIPVPPHGDLKDADAMIKELAIDDLDDHNGATLLMAVFLEVLKAAPTIIPSEEGE